MNLLWRLNQYERPLVGEAMKEALLEKTKFMEEQIENLNRATSRLVSAVSEAAEDALRDARRGLKRSYAAAEGLIGEAAQTIKHHPVRCVTIAFGVGLALGWLLSRRGQNRY